MRAALTTHSHSQLDELEWQSELSSWGATCPDWETPEEIELWPENLAAVEWWLTIPGFLKWQNGFCLGMDTHAVQADAQLSGRTVSPSDYAKLKAIAATACDLMNTRPLR
ncbi:DUF1799 domain-containing protein [Vibrio cholerae]|uniref:DUF1799 domain-containing protein n=1 Tax=Vibrio cholerae TaxID=666 RepID=UPI00163B750F|nr:DUF1799 domain-containing protein [Vibrio cholerae]EIN5959845.1 DUF1799 domain-containing protein [Vibrio cholerae]ELJ8687148.1 DUF1799 domain-containing protein [Vibrio cholerae]HDZ9323804.1 DUF1799 domain-containing protein [Vibrio cholerae]